MTAALKKPSLLGGHVLSYRHQLLVPDSSQTFITVMTSLEMAADRDGLTVGFTTTYSLEGRLPDGTVGCQVNVMYHLRYSVPSNFGKAAIRLLCLDAARTAHDHLRQELADMVGKMGLPHLTLGAFGGIDTEALEIH